MLKRFAAKSRRHSADEVNRSSTPVAGSLEEASGHQLTPGRSLEGQIQALNTALLRVSRNKYSRRSCGDAPSMQSLLASVDERTTCPRPRSDMDYQTVTAVPAFIVEHEPEKQPQPQRGLGIWGRRMSKKIESFRRAGSRESTCSPPEMSVNIPTENNNDYIRNNNHDGQNNNNNNNNKNNNNNSYGRCTISDDRIACSPSVREKGKKREKEAASVQKSGESKKSDGNKADRKLSSSGNSHRSPSPFKSFFIRMGSTGMLNSTRGHNNSNNGRSEHLEQARTALAEKDALFRSCSTSHLNASPTYVKGDDPSDGIDLRISNRRDRTVSCDDLAAHDRANDERVFANDAPPSLRHSLSIFGGRDSNDSSESRNDVFRESSVRDSKETKKCNFPHAFLRSRLSVLPEERQQQQQQQHHNSTRDDRLFKATSEEHFPTTKMGELYEGTTTLGRRGATRMNGGNTGPGHRQYWRNSYAESASRCDNDDRFLTSPSPCASDRTTEDNRRHEDQSRDGVYQRTRRSAAPIANLVERRFSETRFPMVDLDIATTLRNHRRNSAPSVDQRLSSHYVSSNESGYDSDGPRGETTLASESENIGPRCVNTDSSDTGSVVDSEIEKPRRRSSPRENRDLADSTCLARSDSTGADPNGSVADFGIGSLVASSLDDLDGLRWHQSSSGRILPSIDRRDCNAMNAENPVESRLSGCLSDETDDAVIFRKQSSSYVAPHRARLQRDKTRFLSDIVQPSTGRIRRRRLVQLDKDDSRESLGIRLAQQRNGDEPRYIVIQLECGGIAHRDGRLRLGDEIVQVEGKELRSLDGLAEVQQFLKSFTGNSRIRLVTAYEETLPPMLDEVIGPERTESRQSPNCAREQLGIVSPRASEPTDRRESSSLSSSSSSSSSSIDERIVAESGKRPDYLPVSPCSRNDIPRDNDPLTIAENPVQLQQQYLTRHVAKFQKGYGKPSLGFSVVGGRDSPRGEMGIFVRRVFPGGQADVSRSLFQGDEILSLNGQILRGYTHREVIELFKAVREGPVELDLARRNRYSKTPVQSTPY